MKMKKIIEKMVRQEIKDILAENEASIEEMVKASLLPELKAAVRESVHKALEDLIEEPPEIQGDSTLSLIRPLDIAPQTSDLEPRTSDVGTPESAPPQSAIRNPQSAMGRYLYCIADSSEAVSLGNIGIEENEVYSIPYKDLCAVIHNCPATPYESEDKEIVKEWGHSASKGGGCGLGEVRHADSYRI